MKKVLFATTALVATSGFAAADVTLTGSAEIGVYNSDYSALVNGDGATAGGLIGDGETRFHHDLDVRFTLSGTTDNGLTFGATIDLDELDDQPTAGDIGRDSGNHAVFISGDFGTVTMGDTDGAFDWALTEVGIGSAINDDHTTHAGFSGNAGLDGTYDGQILRYDNTFGDFGVALSAELQDTAAGGDTVWGLGARYSFDGISAAGDLSVGLGYQTDGTRDIWGMSLNAEFNNGFQAILNYSDLDGQAAGDNDKHLGLGIGYSMNALTVSANYGEYDLVGGGSTDGWGLAANYDLGGGAVVQFGYGKGDYAATSTATVDDDTAAAVALAGTSRETWSLGIAMSF
ncbi:porin [Aliiroseovarius sp. YM-037]|uniref:porin n=1 Tax=Aliiroseovarius sp. YM-037 TaxID=3341728 RepID=UPI003A80C991